MVDSPIGLLEPLTEHEQVCEAMVRGPGTDLLQSKEAALVVITAEQSMPELIVS